MNTINNISGDLNNNIAICPTDVTDYEEILTSVIVVGLKVLVGFFVHSVMLLVLLLIYYLLITFTIEDVHTNIAAVGPLPHF